MKEVENQAASVEQCEKWDQGWERCRDGGDSNGEFRAFVDFRCCLHEHDSETVLAATGDFSNTWNCCQPGDQELYQSGAQVQGLSFGPS